MPVIVTWSFRQNLPSINSATQKQIIVGPSQEHRQTVTFKSSAPLSEFNYQSLLSLIQLTAVGQQSRNALLLNGRRNLVADFEPHGIVAPRPKQVLITAKGTHTFIYLNIII